MNLPEKQPNLLSCIISVDSRGKSHSAAPVSICKCDLTASSLEVQTCVFSSVSISSSTYHRVQYLTGLLHFQEVEQQSRNVKYKQAFLWACSQGSNRGLHHRQPLLGAPDYAVHKRNTSHPDFCFSVPSLMSLCLFLSHLSPSPPDPCLSVCLYLSFMSPF